MERLNFTTPSDLSISSLVWAVSQLRDRGETPRTLTVAREAKHFASYILWQIGEREVAVAVSETLPEDAWFLIGRDIEVYSDGG